MHTYVFRYQGTTTLKKKPSQILNYEVPMYVYFYFVKRDQSNNWLIMYNNAVCTILENFCFIGVKIDTNWNQSFKFWIGKQVVFVCGFNLFSKLSIFTTKYYYKVQNLLFLNQMI